jgi:4'-phosphopantetheinyl transferase
VREISSPPHLKFKFQELMGLIGGATVGPLTVHEAHVYHGPLDPQSNEIPQSLTLLSEDEKHRASRFHFEKNRNEFILSRGGLRSLLGSYLQIPAHEIRFAYTSHGKPFLADPAQQKLEFNISHTDGLVAFAFAWNHAIGVDVEAIRTNFKAEEIAERFFSDAERKAIHEYPSAERHPAFFRCWTRKEAYIKARGEGLSHPLSQFDVSLDITPAQTLLATRPDPLEARCWVLQPFTTLPGFAAAVAVNQKPTI